MNDYYVYVYIDPRSFEEFYYGKGRGSRKSAHLKDASDTGKARLIKEIRSAGLEPIIKVVAGGLSEDQALLVEKTLIWKLGRTLTNESSGHFAGNFRPHRTLDRDLPGFDYENDVYYVNVGEGRHRNWDDCRRFGFMSAGAGPKYREQIGRLVTGDVVAAYLAKSGYVGIGIVEAKAIPVKEFMHRGRKLNPASLAQPGLFEHQARPDNSEYLARVRWVKSVGREKAFFKRNAGLFTTQLVRASLSRQRETLAFLEKSFKIKILDLLVGS